MMICNGFSHRSHALFQRFASRESDWTCFVRQYFLLSAYLEILCLSRFTVGALKAQVTYGAQTDIQVDGCAKSKNAVKTGTGSSFSCHCGLGSAKHRRHARK